MVKNKQMVSLNGTKLITAVEPKNGGKYQIIDVADFKSPKGDKGIRLKLVPLNNDGTMNGKDKQDYSTILWIRPEIGLKSKLGAIIVALSEIGNDGNHKSPNPDTWIGRKIEILMWEERNRQVREIKD